MSVIKRRVITAKDYEKLATTTAAPMAYRQLRKPLLAAFDVYKSQVAYGVKAETEGERQEILAWYQALLDKEGWAITQIPEGIRPYIGGTV